MLVYQRVMETKHVWSELSLRNLCEISKNPTCKKQLQVVHVWWF